MDLSLPSRAFWAARFRPPEPDELLRTLAAEARELRALGAALVELPGDLPAVSAAHSSPGFWSRVADVLAGEELGATVHLPFAWVDLTALDREVWEGSVRSVEAAMAGVRPLAPRMLAVHPANYATRAVVDWAPAAERPALTMALGSRLVEALRRLRGAPGGEVLALENLEGLPAEVFTIVVEAAGVGVCLDVGHAVAEGQDPVALAAAWRERLVGLHLHDAVRSRAGGDAARSAGGGATRGAGDETSDPAEALFESAHMSLGTGVLDLDRLVAALVAAAFDGPVVIEVIGEHETSTRRYLECLARHRPRGRPGGCG